MSRCIDMSAPEPVFEEPWHAQVFALTVHLNESGRFTWAEWVARFSATLKQRGLSRELDGGADYFAAWLATLEMILAETAVVTPAEAEIMRHRWQEAYLTTPHGMPVRLVD